MMEHPDMSKRVTLFLFPALLVLGACTRPPSDGTPQEQPTRGETEQPSADETPSAAQESRYVYDVQIGNALTADGKLTAAMADYGMDDTIHVAITLQGKGHGTLRAELQDAANASLATSTIDVTDAKGNEYQLAFAPNEERKPGRHRILVLLDEKPVWEKPLTLE
jgi:hypothetical protein